MRKGRGRHTLEPERIGAAAGVLVIVSFLGAFLNVEYAGRFFAAATGFGACLNGVIAFSMAKKRWFFPGALFGLITLALAVLLLIQVIIVRG